MKSWKPIGPCYWCLCRVCVKIGCPKYTRKYHLWYDTDFCYQMQQDDRCPTTQCDFFRHKQIKRVYRILKRVPKKDQLYEKLIALEAKIDLLLEKL